MEKKITKMQLASVKRIAQNVNSILAKKESLDSKISELVAERDDLAMQIDEMELPVKRITGGYTSTQIFKKVITPKFDDNMLPVMDANNRPVKVTTWELINPETILPQENECPIAMEGTQFPNVDTNL